MEWINPLITHKKKCYETIIFLCVENENPKQSNVESNGEIQKQKLKRLRIQIFKFWNALKSNS